MDTLTQFFTSDLSLWGLFLSSLLGATLLPGGSELVLAGVLQLHPELFWPALLLGTLGNTLGGMVSFGMGWLLPQLRHGGAEHSGAGGAAAHPLTPSSEVPDDVSRVRTQQLKHVAQVRRFGAPALLLSWAPLIGDALCVAAGWLRLSWWQAALFMAMGKFARYWVVAVFTHF
jgi:membrane protein YqaA with SNARE-associated domain